MQKRAGLLRGPPSGPRPSPTPAPRLTRSGARSQRYPTVKREDARIGNFEETKILNLFSGVGISFENIASNDAAISAKLSIMSAEGWEFVNSMMGVESDSGKDDGKGIFITKYIFRKKI